MRRTNDTSKFGLGGGGSDGVCMLPTNFISVREFSFYLWGIGPAPSNVRNRVLGIFGAACLDLPPPFFAAIAFFRATTAAGRSLLPTRRIKIISRCVIISRATSDGANASARWLKLSAVVFVRKAKGKFFQIIFYPTY